MHRHPPQLAARLGEYQHLFAEHEHGGTVEKMRGENGAARVDGTRAFDDGDSVAAGVGHGKSVGGVPLPERERGDHATQLSKPSVIFLPGRLRPMKTMRLSRLSSLVHGR